MILKPYAELLSLPLSYWAASADAQNMPEMARVFSLLPVDDSNEITFFIPEKYSETFLANLEINPALSLMGCSVITFESYQFKGNFKRIRASTKEEHAMQMDYLDKFTDLILEIGFSKEDYYNAFASDSSLAITFEVTDIFEQTPRVGTGESVLKKEVTQ
jgi:hypothetical protein